MNHDRGGTPATSLMSISGSNIDVAVETFGRLYAGSQLYGRPMSEDFWFKYVGIGDAQLSMRRMRLDGYLRGDIAAEGDVVVQWVSRGHARIDAVDTPAHHRSSPTLFPIRRQFPIEYENVDQRLVHVREDLLRDVASEHTASEHTASPNPPTADAATPPNDVRIARWRANVTQAVVAYRAGGVASPMWDEAKRNVARALLGLYPAHAHLPPRRSRQQRRRQAAGCVGLPPRPRSRARLRRRRRGRRRHQRPEPAGDLPTNVPAAPADLLPRHASRQRARGTASRRNRRRHRL